MSIQKDAKVLRMFDANVNRAKEALRVCEDVCRFVLDHKQYTARLKKLRHRLTASIVRMNLGSIIGNRHIEKDVGRDSIKSEQKRDDIAHVFSVNMQRAKESMRVLEECAKVIKPKSGEEFKRMRYLLYALEKKIITRF